MSKTIDIAPTNDRELVLAREMDASPEALFRCWTDPELMVQWFTPPPWKTVSVKTELRAGGASVVVMRGPDGTEIPNRGVYLDVVPNARLVFTDAFVEAWVPSDKPFMTVILTFEDIGGGRCRYVARVLHWSVEDKAQHEAMGFQQGWGTATEQLEALAKTL